MIKVKGFSARTIVSIFILVFLLAGCSTKERQAQYNGEGTDNFSFVFMTDIHLQQESNAVPGLRKALQRAKSFHPEFILTGGDLIMDALEVPYEKAAELYELYRGEMKPTGLPVYNTLGNHEIFGWYPDSGVSDDHPFFGKKLFKKFFGPTYHSFDHRGWHFICLDSVSRTADSKYEGRVSRDQIQWLKKDLQKISSDTPIIIATHIPLLSVAYYYRRGNHQLASSSGVIQNSKEVLDLFKNHNLKLVLQGHLHYREEIKIQGITFISVGAVSGAWWEGDYHGNQEGFGLIKITDDDFRYIYIDYGWEVENTDPIPRK